MAGTKIRNIREEASFVESRDKLGATVKRLDEILWGVTWALAKDAECASWAVPDTPIRVVLTDAFPDIPSLRIYFRVVDDDQVALLYVEPAPNGED